MNLPPSVRVTAPQHDGLSLLGGGLGRGLKGPCRSGEKYGSRTELGGAAEEGLAGEGEGWAGMGLFHSVCVHSLRSKRGLSITLSAQINSVFFSLYKESPMGLGNTRE